jgi:hypothetical protein
LLIEDELTGDDVATTEWKILLFNQALVKIYGFTDQEHARPRDGGELRSSGVPYKAAPMR